MHSHGASPKPRKDHYYPRAVMLIHSPDMYSQSW